MYSMAGGGGGGGGVELDGSGVGALVLAGGVLCVLGGSLQAKDEPDGKQGVSQLPAGEQHGDDLREQLGRRGLRRLAGRGGVRGREITVLPKRVPQEGLCGEVRGEELQESRDQRQLYRVICLGDELSGRLGGGRAGVAAGEAGAAPHRGGAGVGQVGEQRTAIGVGVRGEEVLEESLGETAFFGGVGEDVGEEGEKLRVGVLLE